LKGLLPIGYGTDSLKTHENVVPTALHQQGKTFTTQIKELKVRLRHHLAGLHPKTLYYSKSKEMLEISLKLLI
jgi:IS1 family transposase